MKLARYIFLFIFIGIWAIGTSTELTKWAAEPGLVHDSYRYGDLYRLSNLKDFKDPRIPCPPYRPMDSYGTTKPVHLYIVGDSFTEADRIGQGNFAAQRYLYTHWSQTLHIKPDTTAINILILETVERHFREKFTHHPIQNILPDSATFVGAYPNTPMNRLDDLFRASSTEGRLDQLLFQNSLFLTLKEWKAQFNLRVFGRTTPEVTLVNQGEDIVYYMDTDTPNITSSFTDLSQAEVDSIVGHLNESKALLEKMGFDRVILSVIPNKVSVLMPTYGDYNQLITRTVQHPLLQMEAIDVLEDFRKSPENPYLKGDSHWTCQGQKIWVDKANQYIYSWVHEPAQDGS
ncbi:hypothetical protein CLV98_110126 [Dyadobacter jejuensis]|uniref:Uncharacterized protein n=1 Tax=Dyadobacter jejuensis TaxID=1082580 RepID=A0A316AG96_9BACT|nr:hypothetical protein [Dyadobacter jejuensis]PWJ56815.1 hypothetical protein CLV98_110126 [Dyadobacter jejuensis]